ncbi:hypothetical protein DITRI_Ditri06bG0101400 [Diplodiscus trichospermus]
MDKREAAYQEKNIKAYLNSMDPTNEKVGGISTNNMEGTNGSDQSDGVQVGLQSALTKNMEKEKNNQRVNTSLVECPVILDKLGSFSKKQASTWKRRKGLGTRDISNTVSGDQRRTRKRAAMKLTGMKKSRDAMELDSVEKENLMAETGEIQSYHSSRIS